MPRKRDIEAAVAAYNDTDGPKQMLLPPEAARLLAILFPQEDVCQRSVASLATEGFDRAAVIRLLRALIAIGFVSKDRGRHGAIGTYRLHLPPQSRP